MSKRAASAVKATADVLNRSVFVRVKPQPKTMAERRAVLRMLQRHGRVEMFKKLSGINSFISILSSTTAATDLIRRSPIQYELGNGAFDDLDLASTASAAQVAAPVRPVEAFGAAPTSPARGYKVRLGAVTGTDAGAAGTGSSQPGTFQKGAGQLEDAPRRFELHAFLSKTYHHKTQIRYSPLHGPWPTEPAAQETFIYKALSEIVPRGPAAEALCDWSTGGQLSEEARLLRLKLESGEKEVAQQKAARDRGILWDPEEVELEKEIARLRIQTQKKERSRRYFQERSFRKDGRAATSRLMRPSKHIGARGGTVPEGGSKDA